MTKYQELDFGWTSLTIINDLVNPAKVSATSECRRLICKEVERGKSLLIYRVHMLRKQMDYCKGQICDA